MKLKNIEIENFRHMKEISVSFGKALTVISGLNGTGKSSILGLAGHLCSFRGDKNKIIHKTINENPFETVYSEIFKLCPKNDYDEKYSYNGIFEKKEENGDIDQLVFKGTSTRHSKQKDRFEIRVRQITEKVDRKFSHPVVYLGLRRLYPLAQEEEKKVNINKSNLDGSVEKEFIRFASNIFVSTEKIISSENIKTPNKKCIGIKTKKYGAWGTSAGEDNLGQLWTALISFKELREKLGSEYKGGILLIDEIETSLFPGAQINLIQSLYSYAKKLNLQIIFTTHSLEIMDYVNTLKTQISEKDDIVVNFLEKMESKVKNTLNPSFDYTKHKIRMEARGKVPIIKQAVLCEDEVAASWIRNLLSNTGIRQNFDIDHKGMSDGTIVTLARNKLKTFKNFIFVLDADQKDKYKNIDNIIFLPGKKYPEGEMYDFLSKLSESDDFWKDELTFFDKTSCFNGFVDIKNVEKHKAWFYKRKKDLGRDCSKFFRRWKQEEENKKEKIEFVNSLKKKLGVM